MPAEVGERGWVWPRQGLTCRVGGPGPGLGRDVDGGRRRTGARAHAAGWSLRNAPVSTATGDTTMTDDGADDAQAPDDPVASDHAAPYDDALHYTVQLPATPYSVAAARAISRAWCQSVDGERDSDALELLLSEAVTNAVRHAARGPRDLITIDITLTPEITETSVSDHGPAFTATTAPPDLEQTNGFGLHIIAHLATTWVVERHATGNRVTFTL